MKNIKLALVNIKKNLKNAKELKSSFIISVVGMVVNNTSFAILWYYFGKTVGVLNGWSPVDIFGLYAFSAGSFGIVNTFFRGLPSIPSYISTGNFDKYLLTPKNILLKVATSTIETSAIGDALFGLICFVLFVIFNKLTFIQILLSVLLLVLASIISFAFVLVAMSVSFYFMEGENISRGLFEIFISNSLYHGGAFQGILRVLFIFGIPSLLIGAIPVEIVKGIHPEYLLLMIVLSGIWLFISIKFFYKSLKKYESNNLFGFGG